MFLAWKPVLFMQIRPQESDEIDDLALPELQ